MLEKKLYCPKNYNNLIWSDIVSILVQKLFKSYVINVINIIQSKSMITHKLSICNLYF